MSIEIAAPPRPLVARRVPRARILIAGAALVASWGTAAVAVAISLAAGLPFDRANDFTTLYLVHAVAWGAVGALLLVRRPQPLGILLSAIAIGSGLSAVAGRFVRAEPAVDPTVLGLLLHTVERLWIPGALALISIVPLLVATRRPGRGIRLLVGIGAVASVLPFVFSAFRQRLASAPNPLALPGEQVQSGLQFAFFAASAVAVAVGVGSAVVLARRWVRARRAGGRPNGAGWLALAQVLMIVFIGPSFVPWVSGLLEAFLGWIPMAPFFAILFLPAAVLVSGLDGRLRGVDVAVNRMVVQILLLASALTAYLFAGFALSTIAPVPPTIIGVIGVVGLALLIDPVGRWLQSRVDVLVYGDAASPADLVRSLGSRVPESPDVDDLAVFVRALAGALRLGRLELHTGDGGPPVVAGRDELGPHPVRIALRGPEGTVGEVLVAPPGGRRADRRIVAALEEIAGVLSVVVQLAQVNREAAEARDRLTGVADEERRMVRHELRDDLAPALLRDVRRLESARRRIATDPVAAQRDLRRVHADLAVRTVEIRDLARTLAPGSLEHGDLPQALRELATRFSAETAPVEVIAEDVDGLHALTQAAVHHLVAESILALRRVPGLRRLAVRVGFRDDRVLIEVEADGVQDGRALAAALTRLEVRAAELDAEIIERGAPGSIVLGVDA